MFTCKVIVKQTRNLFAKFKKQIDTFMLYFYSEIKTSNWLLDK